MTKRILICPLDWGLGHASRDIPIIKALIKEDFEVIIAADKYPLQLLQNEFPELKYIIFPSFKITYAKGWFLILKLILLIPKIIYGIYKEHKTLKNIISENNIDIVISDNRFGLWNKNIFSIYITHQIMIKMPSLLRIFEYPVHLINKWIISKYDICWIPDYPTENNLSGNLSHKYSLPKNAKFIGILSRFTNIGYTNSDKQYDILVILSGPEPQRTKLEVIIYNQIKNTHYKTAIIRGIPNQEIIISKDNNVTFYSHLPSNELKGLIINSEIIISRSGYSSIMDYVSLKKKTILVPTPGQTEQEYLAYYHNSQHNFYSVFQNKFNIDDSIINIRKCKDKKIIDINSEMLLSIKSLIKDIT